MADECVVCGEAEEGKPLYKKLGSGEFNVEVITALKALQMVNIPEAAKNSSYICWDCDELIVEQYDRYLREQAEAAVLQKETKRQEQQRNKKKKKKKTKSSKLRLRISKDAERDCSWGIARSQPQKQSTKNPGSTISGPSSVSTRLSRTKQLEQQRASNAYHSAHCLMCDRSFETERRIYQRFSLKNRINDEMDIAQVMEVLGLARHIAQDMKARRFVCNPCFFIIRRNYKDKLRKEASEEAKPPPLPLIPASLGPKRTIRRATTEEHAAEIAKLLPPGLAECYKIVTENQVNKKQEAANTSEKNFADENRCQGEEEVQDSCDEEGEEEEEGALQVSQDEDGNYFIDIHDKGCVGENEVFSKHEEQSAVVQTTRRKKNVLLPRRMHKHLSVSPQATPERNSDSSAWEDNTDDKEDTEYKTSSSPSRAAVQELGNSKKCNICGITIAGKPSTWWHTLTSPLDGFESINITTALQLLETCLTSRNEKVLEDESVCLPCYSKVSTGFKSQVVQRIARHRNMDVGEVNLSRVKVRMLPKEVPEPSEVPGLEERVAEDAEDAEMPRPTERSTGPGVRQAMSEEVGDGEKENMDIEKQGHKRKLNEGNILSDKKRKLHRGEADVAVMSTHSRGKAQMHQVCGKAELNVTPSKTESDTHCGQAKNRRLVKKSRLLDTETPHIAKGPQQAETVSNDQEEGPLTSQASQETLEKHYKESKETKPLVVLKDLKFVLPQEAFSGKAVSSLQIEKIMEPSKLLSSGLSSDSHGDLGTTSSPLQLIFNALSTYHPPAGHATQAAPAASTQGHEAASEVNGCCVVCGCSYVVPLSSWHTVEENIRPPTLLVPVRWVCISLAIPLPQVPVEDAHLGRVCKDCFERLGDHFEVFVKKKVGEWCDLEAENVDLSEYLFTFNTKTMNLEADPKEQSYIHEFEDVGQLLQRIQVLMEQFSLDEVVGEGKRQPVSEQHFSVWLLLVLNELRMQVGAAIRDLARWLVALMPVAMYESGLRPCPNNLASFLLNTTRCSKDLTEDVLQGPIPSWVFVASDAFQDTQAGEAGAVPLDESVDEDLCWEDFLQHVNLDALMGGKATPVSAVHFTQGLVYAVWRTSQLLGEGEHQVVDWLRQLSPHPLSKEQLENLVIVIGQLHNHLEEHPEDVHELECAIIPQSQSDDCVSQWPSDREEEIDVSLGVAAQNTCVSEQDRSSPHMYKSSESKKRKSNASSTKKTPAMKNRKDGTAFTHKRTKKFKSHHSNMTENREESYDSEKETANSPSQSTSLIGDTQPSCPPHHGSHSDDATLVHNSTNKTPPRAKPVQDTSNSHTPLDPTTICESDPAATALTAITGLCKQTGVTNVSFKGSASNLHLGAENVAVKEPCKDSSVPERDEDTVTTTETSDETGTNTRILEDTTTSAELDKKTLEEITTTNECDKALPMSAASEETAALIGSSKQAPATAEYDDVLADTAKVSEEMITTTEPPKETAYDTLGETTATSGPAEEAVTTTEPYKETATIKGALDSTVAASRTFQVTTPSTEDTIEMPEKNTGPIELKEPVVPTDPVDKYVALSGTPQDTAMSSGTPEETIVASGTPHDSAMTSGTSKDTAVASGTSEETAVASGTSEETAVVGGTSEETAVASGTSEETVVASGTSEETAVASGTSEETAVASGTSEEAVVASGTSEEAAVASGSSEETAVASETSEEAVVASGTSEEAAVASGTSEEAAVASGSSEEAAVASETSEEAAVASGTSEEAAVASGTSEEAAVASGSSEETAVASETSEEAAVVGGTSEEIAVTSGTSEETAVVGRTLEETAVIGGTMEETAVASGTSEETAMTTGTSEETAVAIGTSEETAVVGGTSEETAVVGGTSEETAVVGITLEETAVASGTLEETAVTSGTSEETAVIGGTSEETAVASGTSEETAVASGTSEETTVASGTSEETAVASGTSEETAVASGTSEETTVVGGTSEEVVVVGGTSEEIAMTSGTSEEIAVVGRTSEETAMSSGTSEETAVFGGTSEETAMTSGTSEETAVVSGTSEETAVASGTLEETAVTSGTSEETAVIGGTSEETAVASGTSEETAVASGTLEETAVVGGTPEETAVASGTLEETAVVGGTPEETAVIGGTSEETVVVGGTLSETVVVDGTLNETVVVGESQKETAMVDETSEEIPVVSGTSEETSEETTVVSGTLTETIMASGTQEETAIVGGTLSETAVASGIPEGTGVIGGTAEETALISKSSEEATTTEESSEDTSMNTTEPVPEISVTLTTPVTEEGAPSVTSGKFVVTSKPCGGTECTSGTPEERVSVSEPTEEFVLNAGSTKEIADTAESFREVVTSHERPKGMLSRLGLSQDTKATCQLPEDSTLIPSEKIVCSTVHSMVTATSTATSSTVARNIATATTCTPAPDHELIVITTAHHTPSLPSASMMATQDTGDTANSTQVTRQSQEAAPTKNLFSNKIKLIRPQMVKCAKLGSSTTQAPPPNTINSNNTGEHSEINASQNKIFSKKASCQTLGHGSQPILKRTNEDSQNAASVQQSALRTQKTPTNVEQKNEHDFNVKQNGSNRGSKRSHKETSTSPVKVCIVTSSKNTPQQVKVGARRDKAEDGLQTLHKHKTDTSLKESVVLPPKNSKDMEKIPSKEEVSQEASRVVSGSKPSLHRSERVCIKVQSTQAKTQRQQDHQTENSVGNKKGSVWLYQNPSKERLRTENVDKISHGSSPIHLRSRQEGREGNNNTEILSASSQRTSSKGVVGIGSDGHVRDKVKHCSKSEKYWVEDVDSCTVQKVNEKVPALNVTRHKNLCVEKIPASGDKVPVLSAKKVKDTNVGSHCDYKKVDEIPVSTMPEKNKAYKKHHKLVTPKSPEDKVHDKKKPHKKTPIKSSMLEENKHSNKGKFSSSITRSERSVNKTPSSVTPSKPGAACKTPKGLPEKKQKLTFEELMNYDAAGIGHS